MLSKIEVNLKEEILSIEKKTSRKSKNNTEEIPFHLLEYGKEYKSKIRVSNQEQYNKLIFIQTLEKVRKYEADEEEEQYIENVIAVYSKKGKIIYSYCSKETLYKRLLKIKYKVLGIGINKKRAKIKILAYIINKYNLDIQEEKFFIDKKLYKNCKLKQYPQKISKIRMLKDRNVYTFKFNIKDIIEDTSTINGAVRFELKIDENDIKYKVGKKDKHIKNTQYYYNPMKGTYVGDFAIHVRRSATGMLMFVKRLKDPVENTLRFKILESKILSFLMYYTGKILSHFRRKKVNIFYEKFSSKVEEGAYDLFELFEQYKTSKNYFIINENSADYQKIKDNKKVVKQYSFKYYWVIYNAENCIATEAPSHLNILRSNNKYLRRAFADKKFIFLQHGVTYLKCHGANSTFRKGKEGETTYIVAGSDKEKDIIVEMLGIEEEQVLKTGLPIFSKIEHKHINQDSDDIITIMLTWKPYEEHLYNFEESNYYKDVIKISEMLQKYVDQKQILLISHPKAYNLLVNTSLKDMLWKEPISKALEKTKLLITDYSSVCYNSFYQGAGIVFYQPDLEIYEAENGALIPNDDEYIGKRVFNIADLEKIIKNTIKDKKIDLSQIRTKENEEMYKTINEYSDGKNIDRIYEELKKLKIF